MLCIYVMILHLVTSNLGLRTCFISKSCKIWKWYSLKSFCFTVLFYLALYGYWEITY